MATTLEQLEAQRDALIAQLSQPTMVRRSDGSQVQIDTTQIAKSLGIIEGLIGQLAGNGARLSRVSLAQHSRGGASDDFDRNI